jgi:hypothetical protein
MDKEIKELRDEVVQWRGSRRQGAHPYPAAMKVKAVRLAARLRARGLTASAAAKVVGITAITLEGWQKTPGRAGMRPVRIAPDATGARLGLSGSTVQLVSPRGYRVEVPDLATAVALLRELG